MRYFVPNSKDYFICDIRFHHIFGFDENLPAWILRINLTCDERLQNRCLKAHFGTTDITKTQSIHNQSPHLTEMSRLHASIDRIMIELQNFSFESKECSLNQNPPKKNENTKVMEMIFTLTQWLKNSLRLLMFNGDRERQGIGYFRICYACGDYLLG